MDMNAKITRHSFHFDDEQRIVTVAGASYAYDMFTALGVHGLRVGETFRIMRRERDGTLVIERLEAGE